MRILFASATCCVLLGIAAGPRYAAAQAESSVNVLDEIVVTAQKREQNLQDVPISIGVVTADALARRNIVGLSSLTQISPSLNFSDGFSPIATTLSMRGVSSYAFEGGIQPSVSVVVDGVPLARAGEFVQELADLERVEILRGPQGTLFGRNATGGAINIVRKRPTERFTASMEASGTDDDDYLLRGVLSGPLSNAVRGRLAVFGRTFRGTVRNYAQDTQADRWLSGDDAYGAVGKLEIAASDRVEVLLSADYRSSRHSMQPSIALVSEGFDLNFNGLDDRLEALGNGDADLGAAILADPYGKASISKRSDFENTSWGTSVELTARLGNGLELKSISAYRSFEDFTNADVDGTPADGDNLVMPIVSVTTTAGPNCCENARAADLSYWSQEVRLMRTGAVVDWTLGGYYQSFRESQRNEVALLILDAFADPVGLGASIGGTPAFADEYVFSNDPLRNSDRLKTWAAFADAIWHVTPRWDVFAGLRYTSEDLSVRLDNQRQFALFGLGEIAQRFDSTTRVLDVSDIPLFPAPGASIGSASRSVSDVSGRLGASWQLTPDMRLYVTGSRGFVGAGANVGRSGVLDNVFLEPSVADSVEIGMKATLLGRLRLNVALFDQEVKDLQTSRLISGTTSTELVNAGRLESQGFEADLTWLASEHLSVDAGLSYIDSEFRDLVQPCYFGQTPAEGCTANTQVIDGKPAVGTPELKYNLTLNGQVPLKGTALTAFGSLAWVWQDDVQFNLNFDPLTVQESYGLLDLTIGLRREHFEVALFGKNITDEQFVSSAAEAFGALGRVFVTPARDARRYFGIQARYSY